MIFLLYITAAFGSALIAGGVCITDYLSPSGPINVAIGTIFGMIGAVTLFLCGIWCERTSGR